MAAISTPTRRRLVRDSSHDTSLNTSLHSVQNDEEERHQRRQSLAPKSVPPNKKSINQEEAKNHYELCKKMFFENKITPKNAWDLRIIDFFTSVVDTNVSEKDHLQQAASTLEICTKVYSCRVDDLHAEGVKLANSLASQEELGEDHHDDDNNENNLGSKKKTRKKSSRLASSSTEYIAKEIDSLLGSIPKISGVPFNIETKGDPERTINLYTNTVPFDHSYRDHLNDKEAACFLTYNQKEGVPNEDVNQDTIEKLVPKVKSLRTCAEFENFEVNIVDSDLNNTIATNLSLAAPSLTEHQSVFDQHGHPIVTLDGSMHDIFANQDDDGGDVAVGGDDDPAVEDFEGGFVNGMHAMYHEVQVVSFNPGSERASEQTDGGVNNFVREDVSQWLNTMLVGPSHWKNKRLKRSVSRYSGAVEEKKTIVKRRLDKKLDQPIDFFVDPPKIDFNAKVKPTNRAITDESKFILPRNYLKRCKNSNFLMLMNYAPEKTYSAPIENEKETNGETDGFTHECNDYNYDNLNDSQYCLAASNEENDNGPIIDDGDGNEINAQNSNLLNGVQNELMGQTVEEDVRQLNAMDPDLSIDAVVDVFELPPYAMKSKKINMKRIKTTMLKVLEENGVLLEKVSGDDLEHLKIQPFTSVYNNLNKNLPKNMAKEMSPAIAFFAMLHLTNENGLHLKSTEGLSDAFISNQIHIRPHLRE